MSDFRNDRRLLLWIIVLSLGLTIFAAWYFSFRTWFGRMGAIAPGPSQQEQEAFFDDLQKGVLEVQDVLTGEQENIDNSEKEFTFYDVNEDEYSFVYPRSLKLSEVGNEIQLSNEEDEVLYVISAEKREVEFDTYIDNLIDQEGLSKEPKVGLLGERKYYRFLSIDEEKIVYTFFIELNNTLTIRVFTNQVEAANNTDSSLYTMLESFQVGAYQINEE